MEFNYYYGAEAEQFSFIRIPNGGYIIVKTNGDIVAYHLYNRDAFETYLLNNTSFERASTSRYGYAELYRDEDGKACVDLNLQIRFK